MGRKKVLGDEQVLDAARRVFGERGHAATTRDVAREAGLSQAALFQRFGSKEELFFAAMLPPPPDLAAILGGEPGHAADVEAYLIEVGLRMLAYFDGVTPTILRLVTHPSFGPDVFMRAHKHLGAPLLMTSVADRLGSLAARGLVASGELHGAAEVFIAAVHSLAIFRAFAGERPETGGEAHVPGMVRALWAGLKPPAKGPPKKRQGSGKGA